MDLHGRFVVLVAVSALVASFCTTSTALGAPPSLEVNGRSDSAQVNAPLPAQIGWNVRSIDDANGVFLFISRDKTSLQIQQGACATGGDDVLQNFPGESGSGFYQGRRNTTRQSLRAGTYHVLACAARRRNDGRLVNKRGPTNLVEVVIGDTRPAGPGTPPATEEPLPDLIPVAVVVEGRTEQRRQGVELFEAFGHGIGVRWPGSFDASGGKFICERARVLVYNGGKATSGRTDVRVRVNLTDSHAIAASSPLSGIAPGRCSEVTIPLRGNGCYSVTATVDRGRAVKEVSDGNNTIPPTPSLRTPCRLSVRSERTRDHRTRDHRTRDHRTR